jgi:hypothetical protein
VLASSSFLDILVSPVVGLVIGAEQPDQFEYFLLGHYIPPVLITPALHTTAIFGDPIFKYSYRDAVIGRPSYRP